MKQPYAFIIILIGSLIIGCEREKTYRINTDFVHVDSLSEIITISDSLVKPVIYDGVDELQQLPPKRAKSLFVSVVLPSILIARHQTEMRRQRVLELKSKPVWESSDSVFFTGLLERYKAFDVDDLLSRLHPIPTSIALAQAAVETGWGKSRFFLEGRNMFGIWSVKSDESRLVAMKDRNKKPVYVKAYADMSLSAIDYFETLARSRAYRHFRTAILQTNDPFVLLPHLKYYSEQRKFYTDKLKKIIVQNNLTKYDRYRIDPQFIVAED